MDSAAFDMAIVGAQPKGLRGWKTTLTRCCTCSRMNIQICQILHFQTFQHVVFSKVEMTSEDTLDVCHLSRSICDFLSTSDFSRSLVASCSAPALPWSACCPVARMLPARPFERTHSPQAGGSGHQRYPKLRRFRNDSKWAWRILND